MENAALIGLSRQIALGRELDVIANNMANVSTNGYKARQSRFKEFLMPGASAAAFRQPGGGAFVRRRDRHRARSLAGCDRAHRQPARRRDQGRRFFVVQTPAGERYTRNGAFTLNAQGQLVTSDGHTVMGESGPIAFSPQETGIEIGADGTVSTTQGQRGKLRLVRFADPQTLRNEGSNVFSSTAPAQAAGTAAQVQAGAIERSNVKPVIEMSRLIDVNRSYTTISTMLTRMDELRRTALSRLSDQNA